MKDQRQVMPIEPQWTRAGILFDCAMAENSPDLEMLITQTPSALRTNARLFDLVCSWLAVHGQLVNPQRLSVLTGALEGFESGALGLILE
jgi:hypothetical protein